MTVNKTQLKKKYRTTQYNMKIAKLNANTEEYTKLSIKLNELKILLKFVYKNYENLNFDEVKKLIKKYEMI